MVDDRVGERRREGRRATIKALPAPPSHPRPYGHDGHAPKNLPVKGRQAPPLLTTLTRGTQRPVGRGGACLRPGPGPTLQQSYAHPTSPGGDVAELCEPEL